MQLGADRPGWIRWAGIRSSSCRDAFSRVGAFGIAGYAWLITTDKRYDTVNGEPGNPRNNTRTQKSICDHVGVDSKLQYHFAETLLNGVHIYDFVASNGAIRFHGIRPLDKLGNSYDLDATGSYTPERLALEIRVQGIEDGDRIEFTAKVDGHSAGSCT